MQSGHVNVMTAFLEVGCRITRCESEDTEVKWLQRGGGRYEDVCPSLHTLSFGCRSGGAGKVARDRE